MANPLYGQNKLDDSIEKKRNVITLGGKTSVTSLTADNTGSLIVLDGTVAQIQVLNLPTVKPEDIGTYYDFLVTAIGASGAAGSYTINTGGHASDWDSSTVGYDDFHPASTLLIAEPTIVATGDKLTVLPASGDGTMILANNTSNAIIALGSNFRMTAVAQSTLGTASTNVWFVQGTLYTSQATGFVTGALFTAP
tara:strand:- start:2956 stop:3540 length:585 start_codon:yes stop_codon:yes gene_type:complete